MITAAVFSSPSGIIHPYYSATLAAANGALVGMGAVTLWHNRSSSASRLFLAAALAVTTVVTYRLLLRSPDWYPSLRTLVLVFGLLAAGRDRVLAARGKVAAIAVAAAALVVALAGPVA